ncbi:MAG TPA: class I SAM-dependent methyltransferase [Bacteroidetes bacterium]|nr:class I SAM-dependent methyltransferase [Bacteroidota bacterium]
MDDYKSFARYYDLFLEPIMHRIRRRLVLWVKKYNVKTVLDMGCGTGKQLSFLPKNLFSFGVDISIHMLAQAGKNAQKKCLRGDVVSLPFPDRSFDLVYSQFALHEKDLSVVRKALSEARRILKPNGYLIIVDFANPAGSGLKVKLFKRGITYIESNAGDEHFHNFKIWWKNGGIDQIVENEEWRKVEDISFYAGNVKMSVFQ